MAEPPADIGPRANYSDCINCGASISRDPATSQWTHCRDGEWICRRPDAEPQRDDVTLEKPQPRPPPIRWTELTQADWDLGTADRLRRRGWTVLAPSEPKHDPHHWRARLEAMVGHRFDSWDLSDSDQSAIATALQQIDGRDAAVAAEREACAEICDAQKSLAKDAGNRVTALLLHALALVIRARGER